MKQKLLLLAAVFFGIIAFVLTYNQIRMEKEAIRAKTQEVVLIQIVSSLSAGEKLKQEHVRKVKVTRSTSVRTKEIPFSRIHSILGKKLQFPVKSKEFLTWNDIQLSTGRGRRGFSNNIPIENSESYRAISISVDATSSVTGLVRPNDYVDVIGTFRFPGLKGDQQYDTLTLTILQNVRVLATGTDYGQITVSGKRRRSRGYSTVTLSLSPNEVEMLIFASQKGRIHLSLRNPEDLVFEKDLQSVNFKYLKDNIKKYTEKREKQRMNR